MDQFSLSILGHTHMRPRNNKQHVDKLCRVSVSSLFHSSIKAIKPVRDTLSRLGRHIIACSRFSLQHPLMFLCRTFIQECFFWSNFRVPPSLCGKTRRTSDDHRLDRFSCTVVENGLLISPQVDLCPPSDCSLVSFALRPLLREVNQDRDTLPHFRGVPFN